MAEGIEGIQAEIKGMSENITRMRESVDAMASELRRAAVLEEKHNGHETALQRAFGEIKQVKKDLDEHKTADVKEHDSFKKAIWVTSGMAFAVSILWTIFGIYMADIVRDNIRAVSVLQFHAADRTIHPPQDK